MVSLVLDSDQLPLVLQIDQCGNPGCAACQTLLCKMIKMPPAVRDKDFLLVATLSHVNHSWSVLEKKMRNGLQQWKMRSAEAIEPAAGQLLVL